MRAKPNRQRRTSGPGSTSGTPGMQKRQTFTYLTVSPATRRGRWESHVLYMKTFVLVLLAAMAAAGQQVPGRYVVELDGDPAAVAAVKQGSRFAARAAGFSAMRAAVRQAQSRARQDVASRGGTVIESMDTVM